MKQFLDFSNGKIAKKEDRDAREEKCVRFAGFFEFVGFVGLVEFRYFRSAGAGGLRNSGRALKISSKILAILLVLLEERLLQKIGKVLG